MNSGTIIDKGNRQEENITAYLFYLYAFLLPLRQNFKSVLLIALVAFFLYKLIKRKTAVVSIFRDRTYKAILAYYALCILSILYSADQKNALSFVVLQATIPILPLLIYKQLSQKQIVTALQWFSAGCFLTSVYALFLTSYHYFGKRPEQLTKPWLIDWTYFSYFMPHEVKFHAPFFSLYIGTCLIIHFYLLYKAKLNRDNSGVFNQLLLCSLFFVLQALLSSRTALVATILVLALVAVYLSLRAGKYLRVLTVIAFTIGIGFLLYSKVTYLRTKLSQSYGIVQRQMMWQSGFDVISDNPFLGVGAGDSDEELVQAYRKNGFTEGVINRYDPHNQFIMHGVSFGLIGVVALSAIFLLALSKAYQQNNFILFSFLTVFVICCLTESLLQRRDGVLLFSFMVSLLLFAPKDTSDQSPQEIPA